MPDRDEDYFFRTHPGKVIVSKRFLDKLSQEPMRILSEIVESPEQVKFITDLTEVEVRETPTGRQQIKATIYENERKIKTLTIQRYQKFSSKAFPSKREHFSFVGDEITKLKKFLASIDTVDFENPEKAQVTDAALEELILGRYQAQKIVQKNTEIFAQLLESENWEHDLVALGYRRAQLHEFDRLLNDQTYFAEKCDVENATPEGLWQKYFEKNKWIFGYGLSYQFLSSLEDRSLEQVVRGYSVSGPGKRSDGLMKTLGALNALCLVEIKRHDTALLKSKAYRSGAWAPSDEVTGGVAQLQTSVRAAVREFGGRLQPTDEVGNPTGEIVNVISPSSYLVVGRLSEFESENGTNFEKFSAFEDYRQSLNQPKILTFDELYERAKFITGNA